jgi:tetratricopeptide (TPR) repeat protein
MHSLEIDPEYDWTHGLLGDYYARTASLAENSEEKHALLEKAADEYRKAIKYTKYYEAQNLYGYKVALANVYTRLGYYGKAVEMYEKILGGGRRGDTWRIEETLAKIYLKLGEEDKALTLAQRARDFAPQNEKRRLEEFILSITDGG